MNKPKVMFTLSKEFDGRVKRLSLHFQDAGIDDKGTIVESATIFGTLQLFTGSKTKVKNINFSLPLNFNKDLKNHVIAIIKEAIRADDKREKSAKVK